MNARPIRVLEVTKSTGGVGEYVRWLAHGLDRERFALTFVCLSEGGPELAAELSAIPGVRAWAAAMNRYQVDPFSDARVLWTLARHMRAEAYDLAHAHASKPGFLTRLAAAGSGLPVIYSPHCFAFHPGAGRLSATVVAALERLAARFLTARIMTVADGERELARQFSVGSDNLFTTVHSGLDLAPYRQPVDRARMKIELGAPADAPLVGAVGRLSAQKAPLDFVRLAAGVHAARPEAHFVWIGSGPLAAEARALAAAEGLNDVLHWAGQRANVPALLGGLDCFVLCSRWEGFPLVTLEAMAAGAPVVATDIPGTREALRSGQDGLLAPPGDAPALAAAVLEILNQPERAAAFRVSARRRVETEFNREQMLAGVSRLYEQVAQRQA